MLSTVMIFGGLAGLCGMAIRRAWKNRDKTPADASMAAHIRAQSDDASIYTLASIVPTRYGHGAQMVYPPSPDDKM